MAYGFVYIWKDSSNGKLYIGSHIGTPDDGYLGSGRLFLAAYKKRPESFRRKIVRARDYPSRKELLIEENALLSCIRPEDLGRKYYNLKNVAAGGNIVGNLSEEAKALHRERSKLAWLKGKPALDKWRAENPDKVSEYCRKANKARKNTSIPPRFGAENSFYGKTHSAESRKKMSEKLKGRVSNRKGAVLSEETRRKVSENNAMAKPISTPLGTFPSCTAYHRKIGGIVSHVCIKNTLRNCDIPLNKRNIAVNKLFTVADIGKTPRELGYFYLEK